MKKVNLIVFFIALTACQYLAANVPIAIAQWTFDDAADLTHASVGYDLVLHGTHQAIDGPTESDGAVRIGPGSYYTARHSLTPQANQAYINTYSVLFDFRITSIDNWHPLLQTNTDNSEDAELYIRYPQGTVGYKNTGYSSTKIGINTWHRLIMVVNNGSEYSLYLDGRKTLTGKVQELDSKYALRPELLLFADDNGEDDWIEIAQVSIYGEALTGADIAAVGHLELSPNPIITQPWLQNVTTHGITVMWESKTPETGTLYYGASRKYGKAIASSIVKTNADTYIHKAVIKDLEPDLSYFCQAEVKHFFSDERRFRTAPSSADASFKVALWSDSHYANPWSKMAAYAIDSFQPDFLFNAGDISNYGNYRNDLGTVFLPYICGTIGSQRPFYTAFGNHDVGSRWGGGDLIRQYHDLPNEVNSDPNAFNGSYLMMYANVAFISIDWNKMAEDLKPGAWLETVLQSDQVQNARFRFVIIHCAPYYERWQKAEQAEVKDKLPPLAGKYNVNAVFSGHMHGYERGVKNDVQYITIGGGSYLDVNEPVGPVIYEHIIRGTDKKNNPENFNNGLSNNLLTLDIKEHTAVISLHYFNNGGEYMGIIERIEVTSKN